MFKALAHPNRFQLFLEIMKGGESDFAEGHACFLHTIMESLNVGAPTVSHHLKELTNAGLIITERKGKFVTCRVDSEAFAALGSFFDR
jgi:ArsR family transcriptional regulator, arsenate/arsenite/antimonite-responsive transcriptional repressor